MIRLSDLGLDDSTAPAPTPSRKALSDGKPSLIGDSSRARRSPTTRKLLGHTEAREAGASDDAINAVAGRALEKLYRHKMMPLHIALLIASPGGSVEQLVPSATEQSRLKTAWLRLASLLDQGVDEDMAVTEAVDIPAVFREGLAARNRGRWDSDPNRKWGALLDGTVHIRPGSPSRTREAEIVARRVVLVRDSRKRSGWRRDGYMVAESIAAARGWVEVEPE